jgi:hypothetical protein
MGVRVPRHRKVHLAVTVIAGICAFGFGLAFGHLTSAGNGGPPATQGAGPSRTVDGVGTGFQDSRAGAAAAVASYQRVFATPEILRPAVLRARIARVATPDYAPRMLAVNEPGARRIGAGPIGIGAREGLGTLYASVPIGYRIESFSSRRAEVLTWGFTLLGNAASVEPQAYFGLSHTELAWEGGDWKIAGVRSGFGPTPKIETGGHQTGGFDLIALAQGLKSYAATP